MTVKISLGPWMSFYVAFMPLTYKICFIIGSSFALVFKIQQVGEPWNLGGGVIPFPPHCWAGKAPDPTMQHWAGQPASASIPGLAPPADIHCTQAWSGCQHLLAKSGPEHLPASSSLNLGPAVATGIYHCRLASTTTAVATGIYTVATGIYRSSCWCLLLLLGLQ